MLSYRVFRRDVQDLARSWAFLAILILVPLALLLLIGQVDVRPIKTRVAIVTHADDERALATIHDALRETSSVEWVDWAVSAEQIGALAVRDRVDLVVAKSDEGWQFYEAITHAWRAPATREVAQLLMFHVAREDAVDQRLGRLNRIETGLSTADTAGTALYKVLDEAHQLAFARGGEDLDKVERAQSFAANTDSAVKEALVEVRQLHDAEESEAAIPPPALSAALSSKLTPLLGFETSKVHALVPGYITLIGVFVPFVLASLSLVRERAHGTLPALLVGACRRWHAVGVGKLALPVLAGLALSALLLVAAHLAFGLGIKPGLSSALLALLFAATASAAAGLAVSAWLDSAQEAYAACAVYLVCLILLTGMVHPIEQSAPVAIAVAHLFSFTVAAPAMEEWMAAGALGLPSRHMWGVLGLQTVGALAVCAGALLRLRSRL